MHSSRMRTGRSLTICCSVLPGGVLLGPGGGFSLVPGGGFSLVLGGRALPGRGGFSGGGDPWLLKLKVPSSDQIFIFRKKGGGSGYSKLKVPSSDQIFMGQGVFLATQNSNCQVMPKFPLENFAKNRVLSS